MDDTPSSDSPRQVQGLGSWPSTHGFGVIAPYLLVVGVTALILIGILRLWEADFATPFGEAGDSLCAQAWMKSVLDHGWFLHNPSLGAPWGSDLYDFPMTDNVHFFVIRMLCTFVTSPGLLFNLYFLLQFPLIACVGLFVLRRLGVNDGLAVVGSVLFTFLPYHLSRGLGHVFLASYYLVPIQILFAVRLGQGENLLTLAKKRGMVSRACLIALLSFLIAGVGVYYAFFGCFLYLLAGAYARLQGHGWRPLAKGSALCVATVLSIGVHLAPVITHRLNDGPNPEAIARPVSDAELFGLKVAHLLLPISGHRAAWLADLKNRYLADGYLNNENTDAALGILASCAFVYLLVCLVRRKSGVNNNRQTALETLAAMNLGAILLGTVGGFGILFSLLVTSWIRAYNRISIFVAFMALAAGGLALTSLVDRLPRKSWISVVYAGALFLLLTFGIWDQTSPLTTPDYARLCSSHAADTAFFGELETSLPQGAMIFQLPYIVYPEARPFGRWTSYDHFRPYLASTSLRWSFGSFRGRPADAFQHVICACRPEQMLRVLVLLEYEGVLVDRYAYADGAEALEQALANLTGESPRASGDGRWSYFGLANVKTDLGSRIPAGHWRQACTELQHPILPVFGEGFQIEEGPPDAVFRWSRSKSELGLLNREGFPRMVELEFDADRLTSEPVRLELTYPGGSRSFQIGYGKQRFHIRMAAQPGTTLIQFRCDGKSNSDPGDPRELIFRFHNLTVFPEAVP